MMNKGGSNLDSIKHHQIANLESNLEMESRELMKQMRWSIVY